VSIVLDTDVVLALYDSGDPEHAASAEWVSTVDEDLVTTPIALAEMDQLVSTRGGEAGRRALWRDLDVGAYGVRWWADALSETLAIARRHPTAGLADASLVALAGILRTNRIATFDQQFRNFQTPRGEPFVLLPRDA
jgi:predicted nucleic acid-binding protein